MRRERQLAVLTLALLNVFVLAASVSVAVLAPRHAASVVPEVARAPVVTPGTVLRPAGIRPTRAVSAEVASVADVLAAPMRDRALGGEVAATVVDAETGRTLFAHDADRPAAPASTAKLTTAVAVLASLGPDARLTTKVVRGTEPGRVVLVGGGDVTLAGTKADPTYPRPARLADLAKETARSLKAAGTAAVSLAYDDSLFTGPRTASSWKPGYVPSGNVSPVTALSVDAGRVRPDLRARVPDPPKTAAERFAGLLERYGIAVRSEVRREPAPKGAREIATVQSPPVSALVERMLTLSDNDLAEALGRQVALAEGRPASFEGTVAAVRGVLARLGVAKGVDLDDASGLSHADRITPRALARLLSVAASPDHPELRPVLTGLPVAAFSGTLATRYGRAPASKAAGVVRAKTGTLTGVSSLAGIAYDANGRLLAFAFLADHVPPGGTLAAEAALDRLAAAVAGCGCRTPA